jgi:DNA polymerase-3 subunit alpha
MSTKNFVHLHVHSEYSLLDGAIRIHDLIKKASDYNMPAVALTDHGVMYGIIEFYNEAVKAGIKPLLGCEVYIAPNGRFEKQVNKNNDEDNFYHLTLIAENIKGYKNLMKLVSLGFIEGFYYKPRVDKELLKQYKDGLIALSGCIKGEIPNAIINGKKDKAFNILDEYIDIFGKDNFYLEIQDSGIHEQDIVNKSLLEISQKRKIPLVGTNDVHYLNKEDSHFHDILLCIQTGSTINEEKRLRFSSQEYYFKNYNEIYNAFKDYNGAIENTIEIAQRSNLELKFNLDLLPPFNVPDGYTKDTFLEKLCMDEIKIKYPNLQNEVIDRLKKELEVIKKMGFSEYFLIVWDFVKFAKENGIRVGPGRGSAAGSIVSYLLNITEIDPLKYGLLFERFLNEARKSMPDIDIDFCYEKRNDVIKYVTKKYGEKNVAQLITFGRMAAKQAIRDAGRVLEVPYSEVDKIAKMIPNDLNITIESSLSKVAELKEIYLKNEKVKEIIDTAKWLEGMVRQASIHAAGIVISSEELYNYTPIKRESSDDIITQYEMEHIQSLGLLKMDFLGLKTLSLIDKTLFLIEKVKNIKIDINKINPDDKKTFEMLSRGECLGVFQLESSGMRDLVLRMKPSKFEDLIALLALYRPGPLQSGMVNDYIENKNSKKKIKYLHPSLEPILNSTYGMIIYQEQVMQIASKFAGFTMSEADILRGAISKKKKEVLEEQRIKFIEGAERLGNDKKIAEKLFELINHFAQYGFNKSHSAAYAMISYQTAFLKANYPVEFMAALLSIRMGSQEKVSLYINECKRMGISVLPPDINDSFSDFTVHKDSIRFGLSAIKNVGNNVIEEIRLERKKNGKFKDFYDFCLRMDNNVLNKKTIESLIKGGAFDSLNHSRKFLLENFEKIIEIAQKIKKDKIAGQFSLFESASNDNNNSDYLDKFSEIKEYKDEFFQKDLLNFEKEMLGLYITSHPLNEYEQVLLDFVSISDLADKDDGSIQTIAGIITKIKSIYTKKNQIMYYVNFEDKSGNLEVIVFPNLVEEYKNILKEDSILKITGRLDKKEIKLETGNESPDYQEQIYNVNIDKQTINHEKKNLDSDEEELFNSNDKEEIRKNNFSLKIIAQKIDLLQKNKDKIKDNFLNKNKADISNNINYLNYNQNNNQANVEDEEINISDDYYDEHNNYKFDREEIILKIKKELLNNEFIDELYEIICKNKGNTKINLQVITVDNNFKLHVEKNFYLPTNFNVNFSKKFIDEIEIKFGGNVLIE